jgi:hypothetical protein
MLEKLSYTLTQGPLWLGVAILSLLLTAFYLFIYRRNAFQGSPSEIPRERPPRALSPASLRYLWRAGFDPNCLLAGVVSAAVKDCYRIKWREQSFSIYLNRHASFQKLSGDEKAALSFSPKHYLERLSISHKRNQFIRRAEGRMEDYLDDHYRTHLLRVPLLALGAVAASLLGLALLYVWFAPVPAAVAFIYFLFLVPALGGLAYGIYFGLKTRAWTALSLGISMGLGALLLTFHLESWYELFFLPTFLPLLGIHAFFFHKLPRHKPSGARLHVEIEEFRNFLVQKMERNPKLEVSEYYLIPYLVALDIPFQNDAYFSPLLSQSPQRIGNLPGSPFR